MNQSQVQAEAIRRDALFAAMERDAVEAGTMFCMRAFDDELFDRALSSVTGAKPSLAAAASIVAALNEKVRAGYTLSTDTTELLRLAKAVTA